MTHGALKIPNPSGGRPKTFEIDCLIGERAYEIKWRDATTDGDHITKEHRRLRAIADAGYTPARGKKWLNYMKQVLEGLPLKLVHRNAGLDAIYDHFIENRPIFIKVQRDEENLEEAAWKLLKAGRDRRAAKLILIKRLDSPPSPQLIPRELPAEVMVLDALELSIKKILEA